MQTSGRTQTDLGRTCRRTGEVELATPTGVELNGSVRAPAARRSISPPWGSIRFRLALRTYAPWGVRVVSQTKSRKIPTRNILPLLCAHLRLGVHIPYEELRHALRDRRVRHKVLIIITKKSGDIFRVGIFLDFVRLATRTMHPHGAYVRGAKRNRIDRHWGGVERRRYVDHPAEGNAMYAEYETGVGGNVTWSDPTHFEYYQMGADQDPWQLHNAYAYMNASSRVPVPRRSIPPRWESIRFRLALRTYDAPPWGCIVPVVSRTKSRKIPTRKTLPPVVVNRRGTMPRCRAGCRAKATPARDYYYRYT